MRQSVDRGVNLITSVIGKKFSLSPVTIEASRVLGKSFCEMALDMIFDKPGCSDDAPRGELTTGDDHVGEFDADGGAQLAAGDPLDAGDIENDDQEVDDATMPALDDIEHGNVKSAAPFSLVGEIPAPSGDDDEHVLNVEEDILNLVKSAPPNPDAVEIDEIADFDAVWSLLA